MERFSSVLADESMHSERIIDAGGVWRLETNFHVSRLNRAIGIPNIKIIQMLYSETRVTFEALKDQGNERSFKLQLPTPLS